MDSSESIGVYGEAKAEYTRQLCNFLVPALESYFLDLLASTKESEKDPKRILWVFQDSLKQFPDWNVDKVQRETAKISESTKCDYLEEILTAVFIAHTKVLSAIRLTSKQKKLQITIPKLEHFLHRTMSECARLLWSNAYLFNDNCVAIEKQKNLRQVEQLLHEGVLQSIRGMLPVKSILKEYLADDADETAPAEETVAADDAEETMDAVEPVVKEEEKEEEKTVTKEEPKEEELPVSEPANVEPKDIEPKDIEPKNEEPKNEELPVLAVVDISGTVVKEEEQPIPPTITVDTEPSVAFADIDTVFRYDPSSNVNGPREETEEDRYADGIVIDESAAPEPLDEFESLEDDRLSFKGDEFETL
jgi:hypothetical protein